jgi:hypothetical protein
MEKDDRVKYVSAKPWCAIFTCELTCILGAEVSDGWEKYRAEGESWADEKYSRLRGSHKILRH